MPSSGVQTCALRSEEHTSELQSPIISYAVFCLKKKNTKSMMVEVPQECCHRFPASSVHLAALLRTVAPPSTYSHSCAHIVGSFAFFFFLNNPAPPEFSPLPLHAPLPI